MTSRAAVTLLEALLVGSIFLIILAIITQGIQGGSRAVTTIVAEAELIEETQVVSQMLANRMSRALYVYPPGVSLTLGDSSKSVVNPRTDSNIWQVGLDPIIAYYEAPEMNGTCSSKTASACIAFVAYYPVKRETFLSDSSYRTYLEDAYNGDSWVLIEFRKRLDIAKLSARDVPETTISGHADGRMLADYIVPEEGFKLHFDEAECFINGSNVASHAFCNEHQEAYVADWGNTLAKLEIRLQAAFHFAKASRKTPPVLLTVSPKNLNRNP